MKHYEIAVSLQVSVSAPSESDALEAVRDTFGEGEVCGLEVKDLEVELIDES
jgi:hypothetical protein